MTMLVMSERPGGGGGGGGEGGGEEMGTLDGNNHGCRLAHQLDEHS